MFRAVSEFLFHRIGKSGALFTSVLALLHLPYRPQKHQTPWGMLIKETRQYGNLNAQSKEEKKKSFLGRALKARQSWRETTHLPGASKFLADHQPPRKDMPRYDLSFCHTVCPELTSFSNMTESALPKLRSSGPSIMVLALPMGPMYVPRSHPGKRQS